jgi:cytochrome P450
MAGRFASGPDAVSGMARASAALTALIRHKRADPGDDITSRLALRTANLTDRELLAQLLRVYGAGIEPIRNVMTNVGRVLARRSKVRPAQSAGPGGFREITVWVNVRVQGGVHGLAPGIDNDARPAASSDDCGRG